MTSMTLTDAERAIQIIQRYQLALAEADKKIEENAVKIMELESDNKDLYTRIRNSDPAINGLLTETKKLIENVHALDSLVEKMAVGTGLFIGVVTIILGACIKAKYPPVGKALICAGAVTTGLSTNILRTNIINPTENPALECEKFFDVGGLID